MPATLRLPLQAQRILEHLGRTMREGWKTTPTELRLKVYFTRRLLHVCFPHIAAKYPLTIKGALNGKERIVNLANREEGPWVIPVAKK